MELEWLGQERIFPSDYEDIDFGDGEPYPERLDLMGDTEVDGARYDEF